MKTQILHLDPHDDLISARDKMGWGQTGRILLVWPERGHVLTRQLDLVLIRRQSIALGAQLALVTRDPDVRYHAKNLGIPVYKTLRKAQSAHWRVPRRYRQPQDALTWERTWPGQDRSNASQPSNEALNLDEVTGLPLEQQHQMIETGVVPLIPRPDRGLQPLSPALRVAIFAIGVAAFLSIAAILFPSAQIRMTPETQVQEIHIDVQASPEITTAGLSGKIPARKVSVIVEGRDSLPSSGSMQLPDQVATGRVQFTNLTDQPVKIPAGSVVLSKKAEGIEYATTQGAELQPGPGQMITLTVQSLTPGKAGNLPIKSLDAVQGILGTQVIVTNTQAIRGGTDVTARAPNASDRSRLEHRLRDALFQTALKELQNGLAPGDVLFPSSAVASQTLEETYQPDNEQPADQLSLNLRLEFQALIASGEDLRKIATNAMDTNLPKGFTPLPETIDVQNETQPSFNSSSTANWKLVARRQIRAEVPVPQAVKIALGLPRSEAEQRLEATLPLAEPPQIFLTPLWWPRVPVLPFRISVLMAAP